VVCDDRDCVVVAFLARLSPEKSPGLFLRMAALVHAAYPSARFQVIGYGDLRVPLERRARMLGLGPSVFSFTGPLYEGLPRVLRTVDVLVNPSLRAWSETFCIANVEGMASGVPVVSFGVGGTGEYLQDGVNSVLVNESTSVQALADAVLTLLRDPQRRRRMGEEARRTVVQHFTVDRQIELYEELYDALP
jgi:glycosyltransferase involved in cell wall biosynthesis